MQQLKIIKAIKTNNLVREKKVKGKEEELTKMITSYTSNTSTSAGCLNYDGGAVALSCCIK